jgi:hypothetical protein
MASRAQMVLLQTLGTLRAEKAQIEGQITALENALTSLGFKSPRLAARRARRSMSAAERKSVSRRMKAYWAKKRSTKAA